MSLTIPRAAYVYGLALHRVAIARPADILEYLGGDRPMVFEAGQGERATINLRPMEELLRETDGPAKLQGTLGTSLGRSLVRDTFELIVAYCGSLEGPVFQRFENLPLLVFARIIRNSLSHESGTKILHWPRRLRNDVTWRTHQLVRASVGKPLQLSPYEFYKLHEDLFEFAHQHLPANAAAPVRGRPRRRRKGGRR